MRFLIAAAAVLVLAGGGTGASGAQAPLTGWLSFGNGAARTGATAASLDPAALHATWFRDTPGAETVQPLIVNGVPGVGQTTVYTATSAGRLIASAPNGYIRWQRTLGTAPNPCQELPEYGVTGTPVVDAGTRSIYAVDAFGLLHSLDLVTGAERPGWPVRLYDDPDEELVWGALADVDGSIYAGTGSYCDKPMVGKLVRVQIATRQLSSFTVVPSSEGGGGSIWGWGGVAYSAARDSLYVVTGNAFEGGSNSGPDFDEAAGYGEHLVELAPDLTVRSSSHPASVESPGDFDFVGSPVVFPSSCGESVVAADKNGHVFVWRSGAVGAGPYADLAVQPESQAQPLLSQVAYDVRTRSLFVLTAQALERISLDGCATPRVVWQAKMPVETLHGSPTIAGSTVWVTAAGASSSLRGYDTASGKLRFSAPSGRLSYAPVAVAGGRLFQGAEHGFAVDETAPSSAQSTAGRAAAYTSWADARNGWQSRESGVFATSDKGKTWHRIYDAPAQRVLALSATRGVISVGTPSACDCAQRELWTSDGGRAWHATAALTNDFAGVGSGLGVVTWSGRSVRRAAWPPISSVAVTTAAEDLADVAPAPGGFVALLTSAGTAWDDTPLLDLVKGSLVTPIIVPGEPGRVLARTVSVAWPDLAVRTYVFTDDGRQTVYWRSADGGRSWQTG